MYKKNITKDCDGEIIIIIIIIIVIIEIIKTTTTRNIERGTFIPLIFTTTGGMGKECLNYHSRLAELIAIKKGEDNLMDTSKNLLCTSEICINLSQRN